MCPECVTLELLGKQNCRHGKEVNPVEDLPWLISFPRRESHQERFMKYSGSSSFFTTCETIFSIRLIFALSRSLHYTGIWVRETWPRFLCRKIRWMNENLVLLPESSPPKWTSWKTSLLKCLAQRKKKLLHSKYCLNVMFMNIVKILHWKRYIFMGNIAKGTTDPRVEFYLPK